MAGSRGPTLRAQWLGQQVKELREQAGFTLRQVAEFLERDPSTVSRFESAEYPLRRADLIALLDFYMLNDKRRRDGLLSLREDVWRKGWWDGYSDDVDQRFIDYVWLESRASKINSFDNTLLPGLLQTRDYARAVIAAADFDAPDDQIERWVELRMTRQSILDSSDPPLLACVVDEAVLLRMIGGASIMKAQFTHLLEKVDGRTTELRVLPLRHGAHASPSGAFRLLNLREPYPDVAYTETLAGAVYVEAPAVEPFVRAYDRLHQMALGSDESRILISSLAKELP